VLFVFAAVLGGLALGGLWHSHGEVLDAVDLVFGVLACLALWTRRSRPVVVVAAVAAAAFFSPLALGAALVAICTAASRARGRALIPVALLAVAGYHEVLLHKADGSGIVGRLVGLSERIQSLAFLLAKSASEPLCMIWDSEAGINLRTLLGIVRFFSVVEILHKLSQSVGCLWIRRCHYVNLSGGGFRRVRLRNSLRTGTHVRK